MKLRIAAFLLIFSIFTWAQKTLSGKVTDQDGQPIPSASVTIEEPGKDAILAYAISNSKGEYKVTFTSSESNLDVKIKAFNQKTLTKQISNNDQTLNFKMDSETTEIKEVKIKAKMITAKGDTISYDLKAFENKSDRTLADVMRKIPGVEVNADGSILYQGKAINKYYVEGKDLMEGGYGTINNSLPKDAVAKIEVLENHQPVKILQDKVPSDQAAINIKLKKSVTMTGRGEVGTGFGEPWLWNLKLTPMFFSKKAQWVLNYKTNNMGEQVENEGNIFGSFNRWEGVRANAGQNNWLNVENAGTPNLPVKRYLMNNVHYLSANILVNPFKNKEWELKVSSNYTNNAVEREYYSESNNFLQNTHYQTNIKNKFYTDKLKGELIFTKNAKKGFFKNVTSFSQFWNANRANTDIADALGSRQGAEALQSPTSSFQNSLSTIIPWKEKMVNFKSYISYQDDHQTLEVRPTSYLKIPVFDKDINQMVLFPFGNVDFVRQNFGLKSFQANHSANISFTSKSWTFTPEIGLNYTNNKMQSELLGIGGIDGDKGYGSAYVNNLKYSNVVPYGSLGINYKNEAWMLFAQVPFNFNNIKANDDDRLVSKSLNKLTFEPNLFAQYSFASFWKASLNGGINYSFADVSDLYAGTMLTSPTNLTAMAANNPINEMNTKSIGTGIEYRNPLNNIFFNVRYRYADTTNNLLSKLITAGGASSTIQYIDLKNSSTSSSISGEFGKYFPKFKTNASITYRNTESTSVQMQNESLFDNKNNSQTLGAKFNNTYFSWMSIDYNVSYTWNKQQIATGSSSRNNGYNHTLATYFYPIENHSIGFFWDQINTITGENKYKNGFFDLSYQFAWAKKKIDFELKWLNIGNKKTFESYSLYSASQSYYRYQLRPSQVMFTVKFNFK